MPSVTQVVKRVQQPKGGFLSLSAFSVQKLSDDKALSDMSLENVKPHIIGRAVDCLVRYMLTEDVDAAFEVSEKGYYVFVSQCIERDIKNGLSFVELDKKYAFISDDEVVRREDIANKTDIISLKRAIFDLDNKSITAACRAVAYDDYTRGSDSGFIPASAICPNQLTIDNIKIMVERCVTYLEQHGEIIETGFDFEGGYSEFIDSGDGDILTTDTLYDIKVRINPPDEKQTLQVLMYWIMGQHSGMEMYRNNRYIAILNPRRGEVYTIDALSIDSGVIRTVEKEIIRYE